MPPLHEAILALAARLEREEARPQTYGTAGFGGVVKVGNEVEKVLRLAASLSVQAHGDDLAEIIRRQKLTRGPGTYLRIFEDRVKGTPPRDPILNEFARDLRGGKQSRLRRLVDLRNETHHGDDVAYDKARRLISETRQWLQVVLREAGLSPKS